MLTDVSFYTIGYWKSVIRVVCTRIWNQSMEKIGGIGKVVEIDEAIWRRRKYARGRKKDPLWIFSAVERKEGGGAGKNFVMIVPDRSKETLIPIIKKWILPGTTIFSDEWRSYSCLGECGYTHLTVYHKRNFVDPITKACTNTVEGLWSHFRGFFPRHGVRKTFIADCLSMWLVQRNLHINFEDLFSEIIIFQPEIQPIIISDQKEIEEIDEEVPDADDILGADEESEMEDDELGAGNGMDASEYEDN